MGSRPSFCQLHLVRPQLPSLDSSLPLICDFTGLSKVLTLRQKVPRFPFQSHSWKAYLDMSWQEWTCHEMVSPWGCSVQRGERQPILHRKGKGLGPSPKPTARFVLIFSSQPLQTRPQFCPRDEVRFYPLSLSRGCHDSHCPQHSHDSSWHMLKGFKTRCPQTQAFGCTPCGGGQPVLSAFLRINSFDKTCWVLKMCKLIIANIQHSIRHSVDLRLFCSRHQKWQRR